MSSRRRPRRAPGAGGRWRVRILSLLVLALFAVAALRAAHLQLVQAPQLRERADDQMLRRVELLPARGAIFDRNGRELAVSISGTSVFADPSLLLQDRPGLARLCAALALDVGEVGEQLRSGGRRFAWLKRGVTPPEAQAVRGLGVRGVGVAGEPQRYYPKKDLAGQLLGFVGVDGKGLGGIEYRYDAQLRGRRQALTAERDARGGLLLSEAPDSPASKGHSLVLTVDETIQHIVEEELNRAVETSAARGGFAVLLEPATGEVLALAQAPGFNPNALAASRAEDRKLRALTDVYEPGSTFKALFMGVLLERGLVRETDRVFCENGSWRTHDRTIHDHLPHGWLTAAEVLTVSSNIGVAKLSEKIDPADLYRGLQAFGIGSSTGVGLPGESRGILPEPREWSKLTPKTMAYGYGVSTTGLQIAAAFAAVANGGVLMRPTLVREVRDGTGRTVESFAPQVAGQALSAATAERLTRLLENVVASEQGTGQRAAVPGYRVAGKTGTAWKPDRDGTGYQRRRVIASFAGFAPARTPRLAALVAVDEPTRGSRYGGMVAAPAFAEMARRTLGYLGVPPEPALVAGGDPEPRPRPRARQRTETTPAGMMPDLDGLTMREVLRKLEAVACAEPALLGTGLAHSQDPVPGARLREGQTCRVVFRPAF